MQNPKIEKLLARQQAIRDAIKDETRRSKLRRQKALFAAVKRAGLLELTDDEIEKVLHSYQTSNGMDGGDGGQQP